MYFYGRDKYNRPIFCVDVGKLQNLDPVPGEIEAATLPTILFEYCRKYMFHKGSIENVVIIIDCTDFAYSKVNLGPIKALLKVLSGQYKCISRAVMVCNAPMAVNLVYNTLYYFLNYQLRRKI